MRDSDHSRSNPNDYSTRFPLSVIGSAMIAMTAYLVVGSVLLEKPEPNVRVYLQVAKTR